MSAHAYTEDQFVEQPELRQFFAEIDRLLVSAETTRADTDRAVAQPELEQFFADVSYRIELAEDTQRRIDQKLATGFNVFDLIAPDENTLSDILADLLDPKGTHGQGNLFLKLLFDRLGFPWEGNTRAVVYPKKAIREVVGNALVHQDLTERGTGVTVEIFNDRIEVTNPGLPILPVDRFIDENQSRNEKFADALRQLGICEERGYGMDAVVTEIEGAMLPPYQCRLASHHTTVILSRYKLLKNLTPEERTHAVYQHCCLRFVNNQITNNESIRERFKIEKQNAATASRLLAEAVAAKKIKPVDANAANKLMRYVPYWA